MSRDRNRTLIGLEGLAAAVVLNLATGFASMYAARMGASDYQIGLLQSLPPLFGLVVMIPGALATDRMRDKRRMAEISILATAVLFLGVGLTPFLGAASVGSMIALFALTNAPLALYNTSWQAWFSDVVPPALRNDTYAHRTKLTYLVGAIVLLGTGLLLAYAPGSDGDRIRLYQVFYGLAFLVSFVQLRFLRGVRTPPPHDPDAAGAFRLRASIAALLRNRAFLGFAGLALVFYVGWQFSWPLFFIAQVRYLGADEAWLSWISVSTSLLNLATTGYWSRFIDRHGVRATLVVGMVGLGTNPLIYAVATLLPSGVALPFLFALNAIVGLTFSAYQLSLLQCLLEVVGEKDKTFRIGVFSSLTLLSNILSPMAGVWLYAALGSDQRAIILTMGISTVLRFVGAGLFLLRWRALRGTPDIGRKTASPVEAVQATGALGTGASASDPAATE